MAGETQPPNQITEALQRAAQTAQRQQSKGQGAPQQDGRFPNDRSGGRDDNRNGRGGRGDFRSEGRDYQGDRGRGGRGGGNGRGQWQNNDGRSDGYRNDGQRNDTRFEGNQNGGFAARAEQQPVQTEAKDKKPIAGQEVIIKSPENKIAKLILGLGNISFAIKTIYLYTSKCLTPEDNETDDVTNEKARLTVIFNELLDASNELLKFITSKEEKPTMVNLEITKSQATVEIMEILWEIDNLDPKISKRLPKKNTVEWRKIEMAKNQLREFIGDHESVTAISPTLRPDVLAPKLASVGTTKPVKSPEEIAAKKLAEEKEKNGKIIERRKGGEDFTVEKLIGEGYSKDIATNLIKILGLIKVQVAV